MNTDKATQGPGGERIAECIFSINRSFQGGKLTNERPDRAAPLARCEHHVTQDNGGNYHCIRFVYADQTYDSVMVPVGATRGIVVNAVAGLSRSIDRLTDHAPTPEPKPLALGDALDFLGRDVMVCNINDDTITCMDSHGDVIHFRGAHAEALRAYVRRPDRLARLCDEVRA